MMIVWKNVANATSDRWKDEKEKPMQKDFDRQLNALMRAGSPPRLVLRWFSVLRPTTVFGGINNLKGTKEGRADFWLAGDEKLISGIKMNNPEDKKKKAGIQNKTRDYDRKIKDIG